MFYRFYRWLRNFFGFTHSQANGFIILLPLLSLLIFSEPLYRAYLSRQPRDYSSDIHKLDSLVANWSYVDSSNFSPPSNNKDFVRHSAHKRFKFNPNSENRENLIALGFTERIADRILNYRQKGGKFRRKGDLQKIFGIDSALCVRLWSFIDLPENPAHVEQEFKERRVDFAKNAKVETIAVDLNIADTAVLKKVNGIGEKLALRIIRYRASLGGFISMEQLKEVYGLDSTVIKRINNAYFIAHGFEPQRLVINQCTAEQLMNHPYLNKNEADAIVAYRFQHGSIKSAADLSNIKLLKQSTIDKITPYLSFD